MTAITMNNRYHKLLAEILSDAGIELNGPNPFDPQIHDERFYKRVINDGSLGLGEAYMVEWWDCKALDQFFDRILRAELEKQIPKNLTNLLIYLQARLTNPQSKSKASSNATKHYNLGNDFFKQMLDARMVYTCGYWKYASDLNEAQEHKLELTCKKLHLQEGMRILDIGCGWGSFVRYVTEKYPVQATGLNVSDPQLKEAKNQTKDLPASFIKKDYRQLAEKDGNFDRIVSLGMVEHVGRQNFRAFFEAASRVLKSDGLFLLHTIGSNQSTTTTDPWLNKYIFPHSLIPSLKQLTEAMEGLFVIEDLHNFGPYYDHTLMAWHENFEAYSKVKTLDRQFYRMWRYYLLCCAGTFRARKNQLWQLVLSPQGCLGGYTPVRSHNSGLP